MKTWPPAPRTVHQFLAAAVTLVILAAAPCACSEESGSLGGDDLWWDGFAPYGATGPLENTNRSYINAAAVFEGELIVAGEFRFMDGVPVPGIARWTGREWQPFDADGLPWTVRVLAVYEGTLVAGGYFSAANETAVSCLYRYTPGGWEPFGPDTLKTPYSVVHRLKVAGGDLYVLARAASTRVIAKWNGSSWEELDIWGWLQQRNDAYVYFYDIDVFEDDLIVAGEFLMDESDTMGHVARWTGSGLELLGGGTDRTALALTVHEGRLFVGGEFTRTGGGVSGPVAAWDGSVWAPLGVGFQGGWDVPSVSDFLVSGEMLYAYGDIDRIDTIATSRLVVWNGSSWAITSWFWDDYVHLHPKSLIDYNGLPLFAGRLEVGSRYFYGLANWDGESWKPFSDPGIMLNDYPTAFLATENGLVAAGEFTLPGTFVATRGIALWDGSAWRFLARYIDGLVYALAEYQGRLVAGGRFTSIDGVDADYVAYRYDKGWKQVGNGMDDFVRALEVYDGHLIAGGDFHRAGSREADLVAAWDGLSWSPVGTGLHGGGLETVYDFEIYGGKLVAGGTFFWAGDVAVDRVAAWDGISWSPLGPLSVFGEQSGWGMGLSVGQLESWRGRLVARGRFEVVDGQPANGLAVWDGECWTPLLPALQGVTDVIAVHQDRLVAAGGLSWDGEDYSSPGAILQHDGTRWLTMGSGLTAGLPSYRSTDVSALATCWGSLFVGGRLERAGTNLSSYIARWDGMSLAPPPVDRLRAAPNPTVDRSTLEFRLDGPGHAVVRVFDIQGRSVATLRDGFMTGGDHTATWDLRDATGRRVPAGVYFLRVDSPFSRATEKVVVIR